MGWLVPSQPTSLRMVLPVFSTPVLTDLGIMDSFFFESLFLFIPDLFYGYDFPSLQGAGFPVEQGG
jgi:hypothetical protein